MKFVSVDQWGVQRRFWCTSNILSQPERYRRSQYTPRSSWRRRTYSSWYMRTTRRRMRSKDLKTVTTTATTTLEATFPLTMESTHKHAMLLQASQPVSPPAIPPPPCRAERDLYETALFHLTYHRLLYNWRRSWPWFFGWSWCCFGVFFFFFMWWVSICVVWVFAMCEYYLLKDDVAKVLQATQMYEFQTKKNSWEKNRRKCHRSLDPSYLVRTYEF